MKKVMMLAVITALGLVSCKDNANDKKVEESHEVVTEQMNHQTNDSKYEIVSLSHSDVNKGILDSYFDIKEALQEDDAIEAKKEAEVLLHELSVLKTDNAEAVALVEEIKKNTDGMMKEDLKEQRAHFELLSHQIKQLIEKVGSDRIVYEQYCPMYNDNQGGMWLSEEEALLNPLFGSMMLKCGSTKLEMQPTK